MIQATAQHDNKHTAIYTNEEPVINVEIEVDKQHTLQIAIQTNIFTY